MAKETAEQMLLKKLKGAGAPVAASAKSVKPAAKKFNLTFSIAQLNQLLLLSIIVCIAGLLMELRSGKTLLGQTVDFSDQGKKAPLIADIALPSSNAAEYYLEQVTARNIFKPFEAQSTVKALVNEGLAAKLSKFKLVGVAWLDLPETASVMIEDPQTKATYFLKVGEQLEGVTIKTIYTDRVVFSYENEEMTIKL